MQPVFQEDTLQDITQAGAMEATEHHSQLSIQLRQESWQHDQEDNQEILHSLG